MMDYIIRDMPAEERYLLNDFFMKQFISLKVLKKASVENIRWLFLCLEEVLILIFYKEVSG